MRKPVICVIDSDRNKGGMSIDEVREQVLSTDLEKWNFSEFHGNEEGDVPTVSECLEHLLAYTPIEWNRTSHRIKDGLRSAAHS